MRVWMQRLVHYGDALARSGGAVLDCGVSDQANDAEREHPREIICPDPSNQPPGNRLDQPAERTDQDRDDLRQHDRQKKRRRRKGSTQEPAFRARDDPKDDESRAMADFNELVKADGRAEKLFLTIRDGIYLIRKTCQP